MKIDLVKNFRSRREVLANINEVFNLVMDDIIGGAEYHESHQMEILLQSRLTSLENSNHKSMPAPAHTIRHTKIRDMH